jgi:alpha/beta hydrolase fold
MSQQQKDALEEMIRNAPLDIGGDVTEQRANFEKMPAARPLADHVSTAPGELGGVPVLRIETGAASRDAVVLWFHGGWYAIGSPRTSAGLTSDLARRIDAMVVSVDYRLAPEHPYPAALKDARAAYRGLLDRARYGWHLRSVRSRIRRYVDARSTRGPLPANLDRHRVRMAECPLIAGAPAGGSKLSRDSCFVAPARAVVRAVLHRWRVEPKEKSQSRALVGGTIGKEKARLSGAFLMCRRGDSNSRPSD